METEQKNIKKDLKKTIIILSVIIVILIVLNLINLKTDFLVKLSELIIK